MRVEAIARPMPAVEAVTTAIFPRIFRFIIFLSFKASKVAHAYNCWMNRALGFKSLDVKIHGSILLSVGPPDTAKAFVSEQYDDVH